MKSHSNVDLVLATPITEENKLTVASVMVMGLADALVQAMREAGIDDEVAAATITSALGSSFALGLVGLGFSKAEGCKMTAVKIDHAITHLAAIARGGAPLM